MKLCMCMLLDLCSKVLVSGITIIKEDTGVCCHGGEQ